MQMHNGLEVFEVDYRFYNNWQFKMSSQSGSDYGKGGRGNKTKKMKAESVPEKRNRRSNRKNTQVEQSENALPGNIPISESEELIMFQSYQLEATKVIIQVPHSLLRKGKMAKETWTRVGEIVLQLRVSNNDTGELVAEAKIKMEHQPSTSGSSKMGEENERVQVQKQGQMQKQKDVEQLQEEEDAGEEVIFLVWGKACWIGGYEVCNRTIKQAPKTINTQQYSEMAKVKTKEVSSDIFLILNMRKKLECISEYNGLINQGNTCYMNSYLQMLSHIAQFKNLVFEAQIVDESKFPATLQVLFHKLDNEQKPVSAEQLVKSFGWTRKEVNIQQDAQQFSCLFYDVLERKLQEACPDPKHMSMSEMFQGKLRNLIECTQVGNNVQPFFNISLSLSKTLEQSLDDYVAEQVLSGDNLYQTELYGPQVAKKSVRFLSLPPILMVQLKRFEFNYNTGQNEKIMHHFEYPNVIDFSKWQVMSDDRCEYQLYAVLVHEGIKAESGHYYAFVNIHDEWYRFNDQEVSAASRLQVFDYNFGGEIDIVQFDAREFKVYNRRSVSSSTAYMLVYVKTQLKQRLLNSEPIYPQWLKQHEIIKQEEREQLRSRKNYYHDIQVLDWETNFKGSIADFLGIVPKDSEDYGGTTIEKLMKNQKVDSWVREYNEKNLGVYLYLTTPEKSEYETLINCQHRKGNFQQLIRDPNCPISIVFMPILVHSDSYLYIIKLASTCIKFRQQGEHEQQVQIKFHNLLEINRNSRNSELLKKLKQLYDEPGFAVRYFYEQKKELTEIKEDNLLIKGPPIQRNILGIIIVQKIEEQLNEKFKSYTINWYNDLKNFVDIVVKSEDGRYEFTTQMDQNKPVENLRNYIFESQLKQDQVCCSAHNIVLKTKLKKTAKNYVQVTGAKTIKDLIKNCDKQNLIVFGFSKLRADQRVNQIEIKFVYRSPDFSFSEPFHVILDRRLENQSYNIYQKIAQHEEVRKFKEAYGLPGTRMFLFSKDRTVINDIVSESGHVHGKGQIAHVLQKEKGPHLVVQGFGVAKIEEDICPVLLHHRSQNDQRIGIPRYFQVERSTKLTDLYEEILEMIKDQTYEWEDKRVKLNPMKVTVYAYSKDYNKGIYLYDRETLLQIEIEEQERRENQLQKQIQKSKQAIDKLTRQQRQKKDKQQVEARQQKQEQNNHNQTENKNEAETQRQKSEMQVGHNQAEPISIESSESQKLKNGDSSSEEKMNGQAISTCKNSKCENKVKAWQRTIDDAFPKARVVKIAVHHLYLTKAQTTMKISV